MSMVYSPPLLGIPSLQLPFFPPKSVKSRSCRLISWDVNSVTFSSNNRGRSSRLQFNSGVTMCSNPAPVPSAGYCQPKVVWIWTESKEVMTAAVERGWNTFIFPSDRRELAHEWSSIALIHPLFIEEGDLSDSDGRRVATFYEVSSPQQLQLLQPVDKQPDNVVLNLLDWQVIPAENIVAAFQGSQITVFAISKTPSEAQVFLEALEQGLGGIVLKVEDPTAVLGLKDYFDRRNEDNNILSLTKATVTRVLISGMGDRVCVDLCSLMRPGEGLLVGSFARGLFLVHSECLESNYIASRPFRVNAGPVHAYVAIPGGKTCYLSELNTGKEVIVVDQNGKQRTAIVGRVKIETRPLILVEAKAHANPNGIILIGKSRRVKRNIYLLRKDMLQLVNKEAENGTLYSALLQNAETVALICPGQGKKAIPVTSLKVGDEILLKIQGGARHTGIEIQEFIVEK